MQDFITWCLVYAKHCEANDDYYRKVSEDNSTVSYDKFPESIHVTLRDCKDNHLCKIIWRGAKQKITYAVSLEYGHIIAKPDKKSHSMLIEAINHGGM